MSKSRLQRQETMQSENHTLSSGQNQMSRSYRWWIAGILIAAIIVGGVTGFFSLPSNLDEGAHLSIAFLGIVVFLFLGGMLIAGVKRVLDKRQPLLLFFGWSIIVIASAILALLILPNTLLIPVRVFLGACFGYIGLYLLVALLTNPIGFFGEFMKGFVEDGCCLDLFVKSIVIMAAISSLLIWHSVLLSVFIGGGLALLALLAFLGLAFASRKEEVFHSFKIEELAYPVPLHQTG